MRSIYRGLCSIVPVFLPVPTQRIARNAGAVGRRRMPTPDLPMPQKLKRALTP
jgi:hypothetical protein